MVKEALLLWDDQVFDENPSTARVKPYGSVFAHMHGFRRLTSSLHKVYSKRRAQRELSMVCASTSQAYRFELALLLTAQERHSLCGEFCIIPTLQGVLLPASVYICSFSFCLARSAREQRYTPESALALLFAGLLAISI
jgi:hypothetical protein